MIRKPQLDLYLSVPQYDFGIELDPLGTPGMARVVRNLRDLRFLRESLISCWELDLEYEQRLGI